MPHSRHYTNDTVLEPNNASPLNPDAASLWDNPDGRLAAVDWDPADGDCSFQDAADEALPAGGEFDVRGAFVVVCCIATRDSLSFQGNG